jgi:hypothetical protein
MLADSIDVNGASNASPESILSEARAIVETLTAENLAEKKAELLALLAS